MENISILAYLEYILFDNVKYSFLYYSVNIRFEIVPKKFRNLKSHIRYLKYAIS